VSGDELPVIDLAGGGVALLVDSAGSIFAAKASRPMAIIGGLAVTCRCKTMVRGTADIDAVTGPEGAIGIVCDLGADELTDALEHRRLDAHERTVDVDGHPIRLAVENGRLFVNGVKLDVIDTHALALSDLEGLDEKNQLFLASHRWALESAEPALLRVSSRSSSGAIEVRGTTLAVATPAALVAMKLHSLQDRRGERPEKEASDTEDLFRLLQEHDASGLLTDALAGSPYGLPRLVLDSAQRLLVEEALPRLRRLRTMGGSSAAAIDEAEFRLVTTEFVDRLRAPGIADRRSKP
jgi:hypothetical protein